MHKSARSTYVLTATLCGLLVATGCGTAPASPGDAGALRMLGRLRIGDVRWSVPSIAPGAHCVLRVALSFPEETGAAEDPRPWIAYPQVALTADSPRVTIKSRGPGVYGLSPGLRCDCLFDIAFDAALTSGDRIRFHAEPSRREEREPGVDKASAFEFEVTVADKSAASTVPMGSGWMETARVSKPKWSRDSIAPGDKCELDLTLSFPKEASGTSKNAVGSYPYPKVALTADDPRVRITGGDPQLYALLPGDEWVAGFGLAFDGAIAPGKTIRFSARPSSMKSDLQGAVPFEFTVTMSPPSKAAHPANASASAAAAQTAFASDLYRALAEKEGNLVFSPYSLATALSMLRAGAATRTADQIDRVLHLEGVGALSAQAKLAEQITQSLSQQPGDGGQEETAAEWNMANALWGQKGLPLNASFVATLLDEFHAPLQEVDFADGDRARDTINAWVAKQTHDQIVGLLSTLPPDAQLVLANAVSLKASWQHSFHVASTRQQPFTLLAKGTVTVPFMTQEESLPYAETDQCQVVELPYSGGSLAMVVVLPKAKDGLPALEARLSADSIPTWRAQLADRRVDVQVPKFKFDAVAADLGKTLVALGMSDAFSRTDADFSAMSRQGLRVGDVVHKAVITVNEAGTEAAAATAVVMEPAGSAKGGARPSVERFVADHPFLFGIVHRPTGTILFLGRVVDPSPR